jgi:glucose dehydrogenase
VQRLAAQWTFQSGTMTRGRGFEATPLALDGVLYVTGSNNFAWALDARTGRPFWQYRRELPPDLTYGAQAPVNRGFAILGDRLFMVTLDAHLLAFDRRTGSIVWDTVLADYKIGYSADHGAARDCDQRRRQDHRRHLRRRISDARISRRVQPRDRRARVAVLHGAGTG